MNTAVPPVDAGLERAQADFDSGNIPAASSASAQLLAERPNDAQVLHLAAAVALEERRYQDCDNLIQRALSAATTPQEQARLWNRSGRLGETVGNLDHAEEAYRRATLLDPALADHAVEFAQILATRGKLDPAIDVLRSAITRHPRDPQPCVTLGNLLLRAGRQRDALVFYDMALQRNPNYASAHFNAGVALTMLGKLDAARTATETALKLDPELGGYYQLASLDALKPDDPAIGRLEELLTRPDIRLDAKIDAGFALARVFDAAGDAARAFPPLKQANDLKRASIQYDIAEDEERVNRIITFFTADFFRRFQPIADSALEPIFVLGMPRSGTTLAEQILASHSQVLSGGELDYMIEIARQMGDTWGARGEASPGTVEEVQADLRRGVATYSAKSAWLQGRKPHFTDKMPGNFMFIGLIHLMFPRARIIHCRRDPVDTCLSCYQRLFTSYVPYSFNLTELGKYYLLYEKLMAHWHAVLPPGRILDVDYEQVVAEPEQNVRRMLAFCGLEFEPGCLEFQDTQRAVATASATQVRKPLYKTSVQRWKKYAKDLAPLLEALGRDPQAG